MHKITIIGKSNVGKSTLFNRLIKKNISITGKESGITRDRIYGQSEWNGKKFIVIDTAGYDHQIINKQNINLNVEIIKQIQKAILKSEILFFITDLTTSIQIQDHKILQDIRKYNKIIYLIVNKIDKNKSLINKYDFFELGIKNIYYISAITGEGIGDLLDNLIKTFYKKKFYKNIHIHKKIIKKKYITVIGRPNVGKSTLINKLIKKERLIVSDLKGTTRDPIKILYNTNNNQFIIDTPGIVKKSKIENNIEYYAIIKTIKYIKKCQICLLIIDVMEGWGKSEDNILKIIKKYNKGLIIIINKCDLINLNEKIKNYYKKIIFNKTKTFYEPYIIFTSSKNKIHNNKIFKIINQVLKTKNKKIKTNYLNKILLPIIKKYPPNNFRGKNINIKYCYQIKSIDDIIFIFNTNYPEYITKNYKKFLEKKIQELLNLKGMSIKIKFKK